MAESSLKSAELRKLVIEAIRRLREKIRWKPGKDVDHLQTRQRYGHLSFSATLTDYELIITALLSNEAAEVYVYVWQADVYPTVVANYEDRRWLAIFSLSGIMETAFPPSDPDHYLSDPRFHYLDTMGNLLS